MNSKLIGGILLVVGTTIGAGMLALPIATAPLGFFGGSLLLLVCWAIMTACAFLFLEVNLWLPADSNIISMAGATLGKGGQVIAWVVYLLLMYSIISAYMAGGGDLFNYILVTNGFHVSTAFAKILFTLVFGIVVYWGVHSVDYVNRALMCGKFGAYFLLIVLMLPFISAPHFESNAIDSVTSSSITVVAISFASLIIIPSLRRYFGDDKKSLRQAVLIGSLIPLFCYIAWNMVIMGVIPLKGSPGLLQIMHSNHSNSDLVAALAQLLQKNSITQIAKFFTSICMATSFLSASLALSDFLSDGLNIKKEGRGNIIIFAGTFLPPMTMVLFYPDAFMRGLNYAGLCCLFLMILMPPMMAWSGRYRLCFQAHDYQVRGGKWLLAILMVFATLLIGLGVEGVI